MTAPKSKYSFSDFVDAWRSARRSERANPDQANYQRNRYVAFARAFGADLNEAPDPPPPVPKWLADPFRVELAESAGNEEWSDDPEWARNIHGFVLQVEEDASAATHPWSSFLEATPSVIATYQRYSGPIKSSIESTRSELNSMSADLLAELYPAAAAKTVTVADLRATGFNPELPEPPPIDDW